MVLLDQTDLKSKERDKNLMEMEMELEMVCTSHKDFSKQAANKSFENLKVFSPSSPLPARPWTIITNLIP